MDINGDKIPDILSGSYAVKGGGYFQVFLGKEGNTFQKVQVLNGTDGKPLVINPEGIKPKFGGLRLCTRPTAVDWDNDGDLDLVVGNFEGAFALFIGEGEGKFNPKSTFLEIDGEPLILKGRHSDPIFTDWDGDGDLDLLSGSGDGGAYWAENTAGAGKPIVLKALKTLIEPKPFNMRMEKTGADEEPVPGFSSRLFADDVNNDGKIDLLVGDMRPVRRPVKEAMPKEEDGKEKMKKKRRMKRAIGHVWLYLRK